MPSLRTPLALIWMSAATALSAGGAPVVVELYTSQGCSSCPPADKLMHKLAERDDVIGLALHVDYWDYIGWKDEYARPEHTKRQQAYAHASGRSMIYTPQMIINGQEDVVGARGMELMELIAAHKSKTAQAEVSAKRQNGKLTVSLNSLSDTLPKRLQVQVVQYTPMRHAKITRGELAGHDLSYANVVEDWHTIGNWDGHGSDQLTTSVSGDLPAVVLVQEPGYGAIIAAARVE